MPKAVLTSTAPSAVLPPKPVDDMAARLRGMGLAEEAITAALAAAKPVVGKVVATAPAAAPVAHVGPALRNAPMKAVTPAAAAVVTKLTAVPPPAPTPKPTPKPVPAPAPKPIPPTAVAEPEEEDVPYDVPATAVAHSDATQGMEPEEESTNVGPERDQPGKPAFVEPAPAAVDDEAAHEDAPAAAGAFQVALENQWSRASHGAMVGAFDRSDFKTPQLKIIQGSGENSMKWNQGTLVFSDIELLPPPLPEKPSVAFNFIPCSVQKYFKEGLEEGSKLKPRNATTPEEVAKLGGTTEWTTDPQSGKRLKPTWSAAARWMLIIEKPDGVEDHPGFTVALEIEGLTRYFAPCVFYVNSGSYRAFSKPIIDATNFILKIGEDIVLHKRVWKMQIVKEKSGDYMVFAPRISLINELTPPDLVSLAESLRA